MNPRDSIAITLPAPVMDRLRSEASAAGLPIQWLVAAFVAALAG